jgi:hypothetical protein
MATARIPACGVAVRVGPSDDAEDAGSLGAQAHGELLERQHELAVLDDLVDRVHRGNMALALIEGPAGIGKSQLLRATRERARAAGFRTLAARGSDLERGLPFGVVRQLFEPALAEPDHRDRWLPGSAAAAPRAVSRSVLLRLARLQADAVTVARAVAVLGVRAASTRCERPSRLARDPARGSNTRRRWSRSGRR